MKLIICLLAALASQSAFGLKKGLCTGSDSDHCQGGPMPKEETKIDTSHKEEYKIEEKEVIFIPKPEPAGDCPNHQVATWSSTETTGKLECVCHCCEGHLCRNVRLQNPKNNCDCVCNVPVGPPGPPGCPGRNGVPGGKGKDGIDGVPGIDGVFGWPGVAGESGPNGSDGQDGTDGKNGQIGEIGFNGKQGAQGPRGPPGQTGKFITVPGPKGKQGPPGAKGQNGLNGNPGADGVPGAFGPPGLPGMPGLPGIPGGPGIEGKDGAKGANGQQGFTGENGRPGQPGSAGMRGPKGPPGSDGEQGMSGGVGRPGVDGENGKIGPAGAPGLPGPVGPPGADAAIDEVALEAMITNMLRAAIEGLDAPDCRSLEGDETICDCCGDIEPKSVEDEEKVEEQWVVRFFKDIEQTEVIGEMMLGSKMGCLETGHIEEENFKEAKSLIVKRGITLELWEGENFEGEHEIYGNCDGEDDKFFAVDSIAMESINVRRCGFACDNTKKESENKKKTRFGSYYSSSSSRSYQSSSSSYGFSCLTCSGFGSRHSSWSSQSSSSSSSSTTYSSGGYGGYGSRTSYSSSSRSSSSSTWSSSSGYEPLTIYG